MVKIIPDNCALDTSHCLPRARREDPLISGGIQLVFPGILLEIHYFFFGDLNFL